MKRQNSHLFDYLLYPLLIVDGLEIFKIVFVLAPVSLHGCKWVHTLTVKEKNKLKKSFLNNTSYRPTTTPTIQ